MRTEFLKNNKLPEKFVHTSGKMVQQIDPKTKEVLKTYNSNREVIKLFQMSTTKLKQCFDSGEIHNGYIWRKVE